MRSLMSLRDNAGLSTRQLATRGNFDLNWLRERLAELVAAGRAVCLNGRWFPRGPK